MLAHRSTLAEYRVVKKVARCSFEDYAGKKLGSDGRTSASRRSGLRTPWRLRLRRAASRHPQGNGDGILLVQPPLPGFSRREGRQRQGRKLDHRNFGPRRSEEGRLEP